MPSRPWSDNDGALFVRWVDMAAPLLWAGVPVDVVGANLAAQMREDMGDRDATGVFYLAAQFHAAVREALAAE